MRLSHTLAVLVLLPALVLAQGDPPADKKVEEPKELVEVETTSTLSINGRFMGFAPGRRLAIGINEHLPDARKSRTKLAHTLKEEKQLDQVVFSWFGKKSPKRLNLMIGDEVPVSTAQAAIVAFAKDSKIPVYMTLMTVNGGLGNNYRVYVGGLVDRGQGPLTGEKIEKLVKPGLTTEEFHKLLSKAGD
jgi:hypothetical protein